MARSSVAFSSPARRASAWVRLSLDSANPDFRRLGRPAAGVEATTGALGLADPLCELGRCSDGGASHTVVRRLGLGSFESLPRSDLAGFAGSISVRATPLSAAALRAAAVLSKPAARMRALWLRLKSRSDRDVLL